MDVSGKDMFITLRVPPELHDRIRAEADRNDRTIAAEIRVAMNAWLERRHDTQEATA